MHIWNPWHGCHKTSPGCLNCYMYRRDSMYDKDSNIVTKTSTFNELIKKNRSNEYKIADGETVYVCMTSDFFIEEADEWRKEIWKIIKERSNVEFHIITKRINRFLNCIPSDWNDGYDNVTICSTCENQKMTDERLPLLLSYPIKKRAVICEPILEEITLDKYLKSQKILEVTVGGESGDRARPCNYDWVLKIKEECKNNNVPFYFKQTGANFIKDNKTYHIDRKDQLKQARKANISTI